ncbi:MAG: type III-B CRISPR-associated protein Cas10/Cmr2 [Dissulfuribacterales bacterium]
MSHKFLQDIDYWIHKTKAFLHDPPDKAIHIPGHEERSNALLDALGLVGSSLHDEEYKQADIIASGMDRALLPGYVAGDETRDGSVNFLQFPQITHPTGDEQPLSLILPSGLSSGGQAVKEINDAICALLKEDLGDKTNGKGLSEHPAYKGKEDCFAPARFHYLYFILRRRLAQKNIGGLGGLWHRLPADTRLPDHSIWQHSGLVSALASCQRLSEQKKASLMVYAITPVQDFVGRARKLRDYWSGSVLLSWLAFEGIKTVIYRYGADHIIYPSLHGQPLVDDMLKKWGMAEERLGGDKDDAGVASFPNKFVCLVPTGEERETAEAIESAISAAWINLGNATLSLIEKKIGKKEGYIQKQFERQLSDYWEHHWAAVPLVAGEDCPVVATLLHDESIAPAFDFWNASNKFWSSTGEGQLYSVSHRLAQAGLAAGKTRREDRRPKEEGIKCDMFGEFEILHYRNQADPNPKPSEDPFWQDIRNAFDESDFGENERLCALGMVKRLAYRVVKDVKDHPLHRMFKAADSFPSTTEMAMYDWWKQLKNRAKSCDDKKAPELAQELSVFEGKDAFKKLAQWYHAKNEPESLKRDGVEILVIDKDKKEEKTAAEDIFKLHPVEDIHKYYAVLMMDGDRMGKLINGETLGSRWETVLHSELVRRLKGSFDKKFKDFWSKWLKEARFVSPAVHAAISEALGDFSIYTVPAIIEKYHGRLIYAGGDDVCAVLPASQALSAARGIAKAYRLGFVLLKSGEQACSVNESWELQPNCKLAVHLGNSDGISISAGIMVAHHKKPLGKVMERAHKLLDMAKAKGGRNAFALEVDKRAGGGRIFMAGWQEKINNISLLDHFLSVANALQTTEKSAMSSSLAYRLAAFEDGIKAMLRSYPEELPRFIVKQLDRSGLNKDTKGLTEDEKQAKNKQLTELAMHIAAIISRKDEDGKIPLESIIVANFIGHCMKEANGYQACAERGVI